jgi:hypothetical protein
MKQMKSFKKLGNEHILLMVGSLALLFALSRYSNSKMTDGYMAGNYMSNPRKVGEAVDGILGSSPPSQVNLGGMSSPGVFNNENNSSDAGSLLPNDNNSKWSQLNIQGSGSLENVNLLKAGSLTGINTVGTSLRNANLQLRAEPPNPKNMTNCPWNQSTIERDNEYSYGLKVDS